MYNAVALEQNKLESYQHSLTESMRKAQSQGHFGTAESV